MCKKCCKNCPYCYNREYCLLEEQYIDDMCLCPQGDKFDDRQYENENNNFVVVDDEKIWLDEIHVVDRY